MQLYMGVGWLGWLLILASVAGVVTFRNADSDRAAQIGSASWGLLIAGVLYLIYNHYTAADVTSFISYVTGQGAVWIVLAIVAFGGYIADRTAGQTDNPRAFVSSVREAAFVPVERTVGTVMGAFISIVMVLIAIASIGAEFLGFGLGLFASEPGFGFGIFTTIFGFVGLGGSIPLIGPLLPEWLTSMSPVQFVGVAGATLVIALSAASANFREALIGGERS